MSLKKSLMSTAIWMGFVVVISIAIISYLVSNPIPGVSMEERSRLIGGGIGTISGIGLGVIWIPFAARLGKERREAMERAKRKKKRP